MTAGLLASGSLDRAAFPKPVGSVADGAGLAGHSCGGSRGVGNLLTAFPFHFLRRTVTFSHMPRPRAPSNGRGRRAVGHFEFPLVTPLRSLTLAECSPSTAAVSDAALLHSLDGMVGLVPLSKAGPIAVHLAA